MTDPDKTKGEVAPDDSWCEPPTRKGKGVSLGWAEPDDPIYTNAGWNFIIGKNLNPKS